MWANYRAIGYHRMIYTNTASVLDKVVTDLTAAIGSNPHVTAVLLRCADATAEHRLRQREIGTSLDWHLQRSTLMSRTLDNRAPHWVHRIDTDHRTVGDIAAEIIGLAGWMPHSTGPDNADWNGPVFDASRSSPARPLSNDGSCDDDSE